MERSRGLNRVYAIVAVAIICILAIIVSGVVKQHKENQKRLEAEVETEADAKFLLGFNTNMLIHSIAEEIRFDIENGKISSDVLEELNSAEDNISNMILERHPITLDVIIQFSDTVKSITGEDYNQDFRMFFEEMDLVGFGVGEIFYQMLNLIDKAYDKGAITEEQYSECLAKAANVLKAESRAELDKCLEESMIFLKACVNGEIEVREASFFLETCLIYIRKMLKTF